MHWRYITQAFGAAAGTPTPTGAQILARAQKRQKADRATLELRLGADPIPNEITGGATYEKAWLFGQPILAMTTPADADMLEMVHVWLTDEAVGAWRSIVLLDGTPPPRIRSKVYDTGDPENPYVILGVRLRLWNASQDLPKTLVGATVEDPDGREFLRRIVKRWTPIAQALVAETVKSAKRPVPENNGSRYYKATLGEGQLIRHGSGGPVWVSSEAAVHLAQVAGYPLGAPDEIEHDAGSQGEWILVEDAFDGDVAKDVDEAIIQAADTFEPIGYDAFANEVGVDVLKRVFAEYRWGRGGPMGERLRDDAKAHYTRSLYHGQPILIVTTATRSVIWLSTIARAEYVSRHVAPVVEELPSPAPRKRGRPRKNPVVATPPVDTETKTEEAAPTLDLEPVAEKPAPRKRGRPRATPVPQATPPSDIVDETVVEAEAPVLPAEVVETTPPSLRRKQRRAIAKLARALARTNDAGLSLVLDGGVLKAFLSEGENKGMVAVSAASTPTIANI